MACYGLKKGSFHLFVHPKWSRIIVAKTYFWPVFDPFFVPKQPIFKALWEFRRAKTGHHELKTRQKNLFWHSMWSMIIFEKSHALQILKWRSGICDARSWPPPLSFWLMLCVVVPHTHR